MLLFGIGDYCGSHSNASRCQINSASNDIVAFVIVGVIVAIVILDVLWKLRYGTRGPVSRAIIGTAQGVRKHASRSSASFL